MWYLRPMCSHPTLPRRFHECLRKLAWRIVFLLCTKPGLPFSRPLCRQIANHPVSYCYAGLHDTTLWNDTHPLLAQTLELQHSCRACRGGDILRRHARLRPPASHSPAAIALINKRRRTLAGCKQSYYRTLCLYRVRWAHTATVQ